MAMDIVVRLQSIIKILMSQPGLRIDFDPFASLHLYLGQI